MTGAGIIYKVKFIGSEMNEIEILTTVTPVSSLSYLGCYNNTLNKLLTGTFNNSATNSPNE